MIVQDIMNEPDNDGNMLVKVKGCNVQNDCDPLTEEYYAGKLSDIPVSLRQCKVLTTGWSIGAKCAVIEIPFLQ